MGLANTGGTLDSGLAANERDPGKRAANASSEPDLLSDQLDFAISRLVASPHQRLAVPFKQGACSEYLSGLNSNPARSAMQWSSGQFKTPPQGLGTEPQSALLAVGLTGRRLLHHLVCQCLFCFSYTKPGTSCVSADGRVDRWLPDLTLQPMARGATVECTTCVGPMRDRLEEPTRHKCIP